MSHSLAVLLAALGDIDLVGNGRRNNLLCKFQSLRLDIGDDDGMSARGPSGRESKKTDRAGTTNYSRRSEGDGCRVDAVKDDAERFEEGAFSERNIVGKPTRTGQFR